jgi:serine/threonine-protein kinase
MDLARLPDGVPFIVMELLRGQDLSDVLDRKKRLRPLEAVELVRQACDGIAEAHELGIVHRDLKPANLFVTRTRGGAPHLKVLDFGCSKASFPDTQLTGTHAVFGTPAYMSPEQAKSAKRVDARTDIWALGAVLYELLSGKPPFDGDTYAEIYSAVQRASPAPLRDTPAELASIVERCLRKDRARRWASADELAHALATFAASGVSSPRTVMGRASGSGKHVTMREPRPIRRAVQTPKTPPPQTPKTPKRMTKALETAVAAMEGRGGATLQEIQRALASADLATCDAKALLLWAGKHRGLRYQVDLDGKVRRSS